ncbi:uncharacterized protein LOC128861113 isoform X3 [Anastrepha ludens]|uniref:uncharacterized protein LOC128861113 isoform X3 n=1 Tax=Anastrepha ludens TaxID=28586 RepID=UPI0023B04FB3|nr:uncharacterized protein LOC128861113 isoform X3 [Anastrepha ludens]
MEGNKRKTRQRNRPRNKANRLKEESGRKEFNEELVKSAVNEGEINGAEENTVTNVQAQEILVKDSTVESCINQTSSTSQGQMVSQTMLDQNENLKILQQMIRAKLLQKQQNSEQKPNTNCSDEKISKINQQKGSNSSKDKVSGNAIGVKELVTTKSSPDNKLAEQSTFVANLQKKLESSVANGSTDLPNTLLQNLQKLLNEGPLSDIASSDDEEDYVEYIFKPRQHFLFCKNELATQTKIPCNRCNLVYYCTAEHMKGDVQHRQICYALQQMADESGGHIFRKCGEFTAEQFRSYRIVTIRKIESIINRALTATEQEVILFPRICCNGSCREYNFKKLVDCEHCGQRIYREIILYELIYKAAYCRDKPEHLNKSHDQWCESHQLFKKLQLLQAKFGQIEPALPSKILRDIPGACCNTKQILTKLDCAVRDPCKFAALSQISTCPLTAWFALKLCGNLKKSEEVTVHLIGAEIEFEVDALHKWELFFLHINPNTTTLNVVFIGPELNQGNVPFQQLMKTNLFIFVHTFRCCKSCRKLKRTVNYRFQSQLYHNYCSLPTFLPPDLICFFNAGLYRYNGFQMEDTWPETIRIATNIKCPIVVTSYTEYESPLDISRLVQESSRHLNVVLPPTLNPYASKKPERNFISDEDSPLMFKNYYCFVIE